jgi:ubiquinone/menaquinone biosynthesis C-methylase UbiE
LQNNIKMKEYFDRLAPSWTSDESEKDIREEIAEMSFIKPGAVIADIGCGKGVMVPHLLNTNPSCIIEIDISSEMLRLAKEDWKDDRIKFFCGDILRLDLPECDTVIIFNALPHFIYRKELAQKLASILKAKGTVIIAHSKSRKAINEIHNEGISETLSTKLLSPLEEYENFKQYFNLNNTVDNSQMYFMKLTKLY